MNNDCYVHKYWNKNGIKIDIKIYSTELKLIEHEIAVLSNGGCLEHNTSIPFFNFNSVAYFIITPCSFVFFVQCSRSCYCAYSMNLNTYLL